MITDEDIAEAIDRLARTPDGAALYLWAQKKLCAIPTDVEPIGALRQHHGMRKCAAELMSLMSKGIEESDRQSGSGRALVFAVPERKPVAIGRRSLHRGGPGEPEPVAGSGTSSAGAA